MSFTTHKFLKASHVRLKFKRTSQHGLQFEKLYMPDSNSHDLHSTYFNFSAAVSLGFIPTLAHQRWGLRSFGCVSLLRSVSVQFYIRAAWLVACLWCVMSLGMFLTQLSLRPKTPVYQWMGCSRGLRFKIIFPCFYYLYWLNLCFSVCF